MRDYHKEYLTHTQKKVCMCSNANALQVLRYVDRWSLLWSIFYSCTTWADHITCGISICIVNWKLRFG